MNTLSPTDFEVGQAKILLVLPTTRSRGPFWRIGGNLWRNSDYFGGRENCFRYLPLLGVFLVSAINNTRLQIIAYFSFNY